MSERLEFFFDPICPWAWITSRWVEELESAEVVDPTWSFISLKMINESRDYATEFPEGYPKIHGLGHDLLRVAAAVRQEYGNAAVGRFYKAAGSEIHDNKRRQYYIDGGPVSEILVAASLPVELGTAMADESFDSLIRSETELALSRTGRDVGTPIITLLDRENSSFFGPVMSSIPRGAEAKRLFDAYLSFTSFTDFCEIKRAVRSAPVFD